MLKKLPLRRLIWAAFALNVFTIIAFTVINKLLPPVVPLFYGLPLGKSQIAPTLYLLLIPGVSVLILIANIFLASMSKDMFTKKVLVISAFTVSVLSLIAFVKICLLVGFF